jgi:hypothetical protein
MILIKVKENYSCAQLIKHHAMKNYGGMEVYITILELGNRLEWRDSRPDCFTPGNESHSPIGGRMGPRAAVE